MSRNLSALAASILHRNLLNSGCEPPALEEDAPRPEQGSEVRMNSDAPRLTSETATHPHRPRGHGA